MASKTIIVENSIGRSFNQCVNFSKNDNFQQFKKKVFNHLKNISNLSDDDEEYLVLSGNGGKIKDNEFETMIEYSGHYSFMYATMFDGSEEIVCDHKCNIGLIHEKGFIGLNGFTILHTGFDLKPTLEEQGIILIGTPEELHDCELKKKYQEYTYLFKVEVMNKGGRTKSARN